MQTRRKRSRIWWGLILGLIVIVLILVLLLRLGQRGTTAVSASSCAQQAAAVMTPLQRASVQSGGSTTLYVGSDAYLYGLNGTKQGAQQWCQRLTTSAGDQALGIANAQQSGGQVYVGMIDGTLVDVDGGAGVVRWSHEKMLPFEAAYPVPVVNGLVYGGVSEVQALSAGDGSVRWSHALSKDEFVATPPSVVAGRVYLGTSEILGTLDWRLHFYAFDAATGSVLWNVAWRSSHNLVKAPAVVGQGYVYVALYGGDIYALAVGTGKQLWSVPADLDVYSPLVYDHGLIYAATPKALKVFDARNGSLRWSALHGYANARLLVQNTTLYEALDNGLLLALDASTGKRLWQTQLALSTNAASKALFMSNGELYLAAQDVSLQAPDKHNRIHVVNAQTGQEEWYITLAIDKTLSGRELSLTL